MEAPTGRKCGICGFSSKGEGAFCPNCGTKYGTNPGPSREEMTESLGLLVKGIIAVTGAVLVAYGGWVLASTVYNFIPPDERPLSQGLAGVLIGIFLVLLAFRFVDRLIRRKTGKEGQER